MSTGIATRPKNEVEKYLEESIGDLAVACSKFVKPETVIQVVGLCCYRNPKILECDRASILHSVIQGTSLGFSFHPSAGEAYLVPRFNKKLNIKVCDFQPGYQGLRKLATESGQVNLVKAELVRDGDIFRVTHSPDLEFFHEPKLTNNFNVPITHAYAWAKLATGEYVIEVMGIDEIEYIRSRSTTPDGGPWQTDYGEMAKKTAIRRLAKSLPKTPKFVAAIEAFDGQFDLSTGQLDGTEKPPAVTNGTGHGSGKYASPGDVAKYLKAMEGYVDKRNQQWFDRWSGKTDDVKDVCNRWQADGHLAKWAEQCGMISPGSVPEGGLKNRQIGQLTAIVYCGSPADRKRLAKELEAYIDKQEQIALVKLQRDHPELFEPIDTQSEDVTDDEIMGDMEGGE
jgi:phage RecT family recombinase